LVIDVSASFWPERIPVAKQSDLSWSRPASWCTEQPYAATTVAGMLGEL